MKKIHFFCLAAAVMLLIACGNNNTSPATEDSVSSGVQTDSLTPALARTIAKEAYIYAYPIVDGYRIHYAYYVAKDNTEYKAPYNVLYNTARVYSPKDKAVQTPNSDTPYSFAGLDMRSEPLVLTIPAMEKDRYFSVQLVDYYTHNFDYLGSRTTGNGGGNYLLAGPGWQGETPKGISKIIRCETQLALAIIRTQLFNTADLANVQKIQAQYKLQPLSAFLGQPAPAPAPAIAFMEPLAPATIKSSLAVFSNLNFILQFCPAHSSEKPLMERFAKIGIIPGKAFDTTKLAPALVDALRQGIADAWVEFAAFKKKVDDKEVTSGDLFGNREFLKNNYMYRMGGAVLGIYGNSKEEAMYPIYSLDANNEPLSGVNKYSIRFAPGQLPPVNSFWSLTMYELPASLLVENPLNRYLINSPMLPQLKKDADGGITLYIQNSAPDKAVMNNWLPAPKGSFMAVLRVYWPREEALNGTWKAPPMVKVN